MKLLIVIPALNEEESIASIIERTLAARSAIIDGTAVSSVEVSVVSDGSTDRTAEIARGYADEIELIEFEENRGYGAAIMCGWNRSDADLVAFLDADGTCDPLFFVDLCRVIEEDEADVVLGSRLGAQSRMPILRRVGNLMFATILTAFSMTRVRDSASGMRVVRRSRLDALLPLPTGLHFTPAMSARAILSPGVRIREIDMTYSEREGESKLNPIADGLRFLRIILETVVMHRPSALLGWVAIGLFLIAFAVIATPVSHYLRTGTVAEWMIYRFVVVEILMGVACLMMFGGYLGRRAVDIALHEGTEPCPRYGYIGAFIGRRRLFWVAVIGLLVIAGLLVRNAAITIVTVGEVYSHWSRFIVMSGVLWIVAILVVTWFVDLGMTMLANREAYLNAHRASPDAGLDDEPA